MNDVEERLTSAFRGRVSKASAEKILQAAANLDAASDEMVELQELRRAARDAGISARSFEMSVADFRRASAPTSVPLAKHAGKQISYLGVAGAGTLGAVALIAVISTILGAPDGNIVQGAIAAGVGSISGVIAYLRGPFGRKSAAAESPEPSPGSRTPDPLDPVPPGRGHLTR